MDFVLGAEGDINAKISKQWFEDKIGEKFENKFSTIAFFKGEKIVAVALFNNYTGNNIDFHWYCDNSSRISRKHYRIILDYVFNYLKCNRLTTIPHRKDKSVFILPRMGFTHEATLKYYYGVDDFDDALVYVISKSKAMDWLKHRGA